MRLQVGGEVHGVAHAGVGHAPLGPGEAGDQRPGGDADPDADLRPAPERLLPVEPVHQLQHLQGRAHRAIPVIRAGQRGAEDGHQAVPEHLVDDPAVAADGVEHERVVAVQELDRVGRRQGLGDARERADVGEHHAGLDVLAAQRQAGRQELLGHLGGRELPEQLALLVAEPLLLQAGADAGPEQHRVHRLEEVVLGAHLDAAGDAVHLLHRRHHHHRDVAEARVGGERLQRLVAVHLGHLDVQQDQIDAALAQRLQGLAPVLGEGDRVAELLQRAPEEQPVHPVVVDHQEVAGRRVTRGGHVGALPARGRPSRTRRRARSSRSAAPSRLPARAIASSSRARAARPMAPRLSLVDLSEWAARRKASRSASARARSQRGDQLAGVLDERVDQLGDERAAHRRREPLDRRPVDRRGRRRALRGRRARLRPAARPAAAGRSGRRAGSRGRRPAPRRPRPAVAGSARARRPAPPPGSASPRSRPSRPPRTARGRPASRWPSWRRSAGGARPASAG